MGSESDEIQIEDSDESVLDMREINNVEFDIPNVALPSLDSILWDTESEEGSDTASLQSLHSISIKSRSILCHCILQGVSAQLGSAVERVNTGLPTVITNSLKYIAIGTSHGYIFAFDSEQNLCWCSYDNNSIDQGAVSALAFNLESSRLLIGYERGFISMVDAANGDVIRKLPDAHAPYTAVLHLRFTFFNNLSLCGDSSGCVFSLSFSKRLGIRTWNSKCLFSGARGEVCVFEPFVGGHNLQFFNSHVLVAMATLSKVIIISVRPRLKVHFSQQLPKAAICLPLISWQLVSIGKSFQPILVWGRGNELNYTRVVIHDFSVNRIKLLHLRNIQLPYPIIALHWLGTRHLALLDINENLRLLDIQTQRESETLEISSVGLVYNSAHFKALAVGGGISEAFALAGERACYNSLSSRGNQLLILGTNAVHMIKLRTWPERLLYLTEQARWTEALNLAAEEGLNKEKYTIIMLNKYLENLSQNGIDRESFTAAINCCVKLDKMQILCNELFEAVSMDQNNQDLYYTILTDHICNNDLPNLFPSVVQTLVTYLEHKDHQLLEKALLSLNVTCLDLHQVSKICIKLKLYDAWIHITTKALGDYTSPLIEFLPDLTPDNHILGNKMLVYVSCCLAGLGYPSGNICEADIPRVKYDILRCLETIHSVNGNNDEFSYPYLRALLKYNTRECLNVIELAFTEVEFSGELGLLQRQRLIQILMQIVVPSEFMESEVINLACFVSRLIVSNNLQSDEKIVDAVIYTLAATEGKYLNVRDHTEREQAWLELLDANKLKHFRIDKLLKMALDSNCFQVAEHLYELQHNYFNIIPCYLNDPLRKCEVFNYILSHMNMSERRIQEQFLIHFKALVTVSSKKTSEIVAEYFLDLIEQCNEILESESELQYDFLSQIVAKGIKLSAPLAEKYLEQLCIKNRDAVCNYLQRNFCQNEEALNITKKYRIPAATAYLLEHSGEWMEAIELLLKYSMIEEGLNLCVRGTEHLNFEAAQKLWLLLLQHKDSRKDILLRQVLHVAAPHIPPAQLLELVSNANFGNIKSLFQEILFDYTHDVQMFSTTLMLLSKDIHYGLAKTLSFNGKGILITNLNCNLCQKPLAFKNVLQDYKTIAIWNCGHCFHTLCLKNIDINSICPQCHLKNGLMAIFKKSISRNLHDQLHPIMQFRPDLEGHF